MFIAEKLSCLEQMRVATRSVEEEVYWLDTSLASGFPGLALFFCYLARATQEERWLELARVYLTLTAGATQRTPISIPSLAKGCCGLATVLTFLSQMDARLEAISERPDRQLSSQVQQTTWVKHVFGTDLFNYDTLGGASGVLGYLVTKKAQDGAMRDAIDALLVCFVGRYAQKRSPSVARMYRTGVANSRLSNPFLIEIVLRACCTAQSTGL